MEIYVDESTYRAAQAFIAQGKTMGLVLESDGKYYLKELK